MPARLGGNAIPARVNALLMAKSATTIAAKDVPVAAKDGPLLLLEAVAGVGAWGCSGVTAAWEGNSTTVSAKAGGWVCGGVEQCAVGLVSGCTSIPKTTPCMLYAVI